MGKSRELVIYRMADTRNVRLRHEGRKDENQNLGETTAREMARMKKK